MFNRSLVVLLICLSSATLRGSADLEEPADAYVIATAIATKLLPDPLGKFFTESRLELESSAVEGTLLASQSPDVHYFKLDEGVVGQHFATHSAALRAFMSNVKTAEESFREHGHIRGGSLPWSLEEHVDGLTSAFERGDRDEIIQCIGAVVHLSTDAALPFNVTADRDGVAAGCLRWSATAGHPSASLPFRTVRHRIQLGLISRLADRLSVEAVVSPDHYRRWGRVDRLGIEILEVSIDSNLALEELIRADREILEWLEVDDPRTFLTKRDEYFAKMELRVAPIIETRIEWAGLLSARLIRLAWSIAGSPSPSEWTATSDVTIAPPVPPVPPAKVEAPTGPFVGSRNSVVFHTGRCAHALRIKPGNLISFSSKKAAVEAGRKPCKSCGKKDP